MEMMSGWYGMGFTGFLLMTLVLFAAIALIVFAVRDTARRPESSSSGSVRESPSDVLKARYARGEIGREEYELMRRDLAA
jgi:putative membrane protein